MVRPPSDWPTAAASAEESQVAVEVSNHELVGAPGLTQKRLLEVDFRDDVLAVERFDVLYGDLGREQFDQTRGRCR